MNAPRVPTDVRGPHPAWYGLGQFLCRLVRSQCIRWTILHPERARRSGPFILACSHLSHLEPIVLTVLMPRRVRWITRKEFYRRPWASWMLRKGGTIPVDRFGFSLPAVRHAIRLARHGELIGIFPEGGVAQGPASVLRGGPIKLGTCTIARYAQVPIIPVVVLGTEGLNRVEPWLPFRRGRIYVAFGNEVHVRPAGNARDNRAARREGAHALASEFQLAFHELVAHTGLPADSSLGTVPGG